MPLAIEQIMESHRTLTPVIMGVLNVTPDSFSDGGRFLEPQSAIDRARQMVAEGADIIDIGAESTRPGSYPVAESEQILRLQTVLPALMDLDVVISIDTTNARVAEMAVRHGAAIINDISAGRDDPDMIPLAAASHCPLVLMHMQGDSRTMQDNPTYKNVVGDVTQFLVERIAAAVAGGVEAEDIILDPGIGFGKTLDNNLELIRGIDKVVELGCPVMLGASRKRFIGQITGQNVPDERLGGTITACLEAYRRGATIFRVHDVAQVSASLKVAQALRSE